MAQVLGDFYYDSSGELVGVRHAEWPAGVERSPMSAREKYETLRIGLPPAGPPLKPRWVPSKPARVDDRPILMRDKVIVKFVEGTTVRLRFGRLSANGAPMPSIDAILAKFPEATLQRAFRTEERILDENKETGERISGRQLADLNNFYLISFPVASERGAALANELLPLDVVETAYLQAPGQPPACGDIAPATPLWRASQFYLDAAPAGVNAPYAWAYHAGGNGAGPQFWVCDLEHSWCFGHEDVDIDSTDVVNGSVNNAGPAHGTAVLGVIGACDNAYGMTGITPDVTLKMCDFDNAATDADAIAAADAVLLPGEVMLLEIHIPGPASGLPCTCDCAQFEYVPVEWDVACYAAIETAVANGVVVVEAGGNGSMDLDAAIYDGWFDLATHDSGAIVVGAGMPTSHAPECWTNYGSRLDVHAYGSGIYTTGYGYLWDQPGCEQDYTNDFGGTSGASPIIVGVCVSLQGIANLKYGYDLSPRMMRSIIKVGATPQGEPLARNIGPMPNLAGAINASPNLIAATPSGWYGPVVPRNSTDATIDFAWLPATLNGNQATTSFNFSTYNAGPNPANAPWQTRLYVDDVGYWSGQVVATTSPGAFQQWINTDQGLDPWSIVRGGRHHLRLDADVLSEVPELSEEDNTFVDWFVWTPYDLVDATPASRAAPPLKDPVGYTEYSVDGFRAGPGGDHWTGVGVLPTDATADYDVRLHVASAGSKDGFGRSLAWSGDPIGGNSDFALVNYNVAIGAFDYGILNWNANTSPCIVQRADAPYRGQFVAGVTRLGPFTLDADEVFDLHEVALGSGTPVHISVDNLSGDANLGVAAFDGAVAFHDKYTCTRIANVGGNGADEHLAPFTPVGQYWCLAVFKNASGDLPKTATYEIVLSFAGSVVDAPAVEAPPTVFALSMPRPSPFRGDTQFRFDVPASGGRALVAVFDLHGRRVRTLSEGEQRAGRHTLTWDGRDAAGRKVAAGVYFVRLQAAQVTETRKLTLLR